MSTSPRPPAKYPAQANIQMTYDMRDLIDGLARAAGVSRAEIIRDCISVALGAAANRHGIRYRAVVATASAIRAEREAGG